MKDKQLQVLLVEDNAGDARLLREMFREEKTDSFQLTHLSRMSDAVSYLAKGGVDILLLDLGLPDEQGIDTVRRAQAAAPNVPMIILTGLDDEALAADAMKEGAQDYLIKGQIENRALPRALRHAIESHRMQMESDLMRTEQLRLKDEFLSHVSHELRSPLTSIYSFGTIIADGLAGATSREQDEYLQIILRNVRQLQSMIEDLLAVTQVHEGKLSIELACVSVSDAISYAVDTLQGAARAKEITLSFDPSELLPTVYADLTRLRQILTILVDNAVKFTPIGGAVSVQSRIFEEDPSFLLVQVSDTGCGIGPEMAERIFEHLYQIDDPGQAGRKGLGLGLYIAKELVTRQGGKIWVNSAPQKGSHFCFIVPIFSIARLIGPIVNHEQKPGEAITLLAVEICSRDDSPDVQRETLELARNLLQRCLRPDIDVLLPSMDSATSCKRLFVVGYSLEQGAEVISNRIRTRFQDCPLLRPADFTFAVSHSFLAPLSRETDESMETFTYRMAAEIESSIRTTSLEHRITL
jgi:sigma-B regulation protein RsbU (phosphoserine phosphatase)